MLRPISATNNFLGVSLPAAPMPALPRPQAYIRHSASLPQVGKVTNLSSIHPPNPNRDRKLSSPLLLRESFSLLSVSSVRFVANFLSPLIMPKNSMLILGMMSGTSADGIDSALVKISGTPPHLNIKLLGHVKQNFPPSIRKEILRVAEQNPLTPAQFSQLHARLGKIYADAALAACKKLKISPRKIDLIGNHGQTIFHQGAPTDFLGARTASTLQIGDGSTIAALTGITTVSDFRPADIARGGQGAPLVPYVDYLLWRDEKLGRVALNIGGIANLTVIPANAKPSDVIAFDTGPGNMLIDALVQHFTHGRQLYDKDAALATRGNLVPQLLDKLMQDLYLRKAPPKSTGREYFGATYIQKVLALGRRYRAKPNDLIRTATIYTALSIADALHRFVLPKTQIHELIISGGGANNPLIMAQLSALLVPTDAPAFRLSPAGARYIVPSSPRPHPSSNIRVVATSAFGIPTDAKEALAFAALAHETFHRRPSNLPSATGASRPAILGKISYAPSR
jgi:anhydro-N-acetylmuramic acid kinase